jgi:hypothetical protein
MVDWFHWVIFFIHFAAACIITFGVWFRCDPDLWVSKMSVDTYRVQPNSSGLWWYERHESDVARCSSQDAGGSRVCFNVDLPLYEKLPSNLGWHLFLLLGHFEWISTAFAFFYVKYPWSKYSAWVSIVIVWVGTLFFMPFRGKVFVNEIFVIVLNMIVCTWVFWYYRDAHKRSGFAPDTQEPAPPSSITARLSGNGNLVADNLQQVQWPAMRFAEYTITAAELYVAVLSVYVQDPPAFMTICGYILILLTNLYGLLLHYSLVSDNVEKVLVRLDAKQEYAPVTTFEMACARRPIKVPPFMLSANPEPSPDTSNQSEFLRRYAWGSYIASNTSTLLNSWLAYLVAIGIIFYQQTFLFSSEPPAFVVFAGWNLLVTYSSFGIWITFVYWFPKFAEKTCRCVKDHETYTLAVKGLDILSLAAKIAIVGALSYGFVFQSEGRC